MLISTLIFLFFLFLTYAIFLLTSRKADARNLRLQKRVAQALQDFSAHDSDEHQYKSSNSPRDRDSGLGRHHYTRSYQKAGSTVLLVGWARDP